MDFVEAQHGNGLYQEGMAQDTQLQHTILQGNETTGELFYGFMVTNIFQFDDYNWDWSLQHISHHCLQDKLQVIMAKGPRVFHIGDW